ncbi:class I SAM-dependent methyltransferase [Spongiibacter tropicus]|jgi:ubiquinone/menaquinone biosynthesis C-methylase UbiE|uniref:class I SAM-dependent methyltransferase n=1 Tax=Cellvibrionales TaxID=1706369 RepID=UPI0003B53206|nr:class I SAM-dependent methyltransferase [Spongiibacter tropicus]MCK9503534.1 methyltransferase domain-containing protein [Porticoccaceae bacterium]MDF1645346.1 class I SAM-dependent methyltransferase [Pseudomonadales bacterium]|tara:strand:+ start:192 stop:845 length:654 start_codon:yes stop_codon:yes gene_type:complete
MKSPRSTYIPALKYHALTRYYDWVASLTTREKIFKTALVNQAAPLAGKHLLDVGCGTGTLTQMFAEREPSLTITGLDADSGALELAKTKFASMDQRVSLWQGFAQDMPFETATFDVAVSSLFFHHLTRLQKLDVLKQIHRVLKPGGSLLVADWGKPSSSIQRMLFLLVQCLDGFETTRDSVHGMLPYLIDEAGFVKAESNGCVSTLLGTIHLMSAKA